MLSTLVHTALFVALAARHVAGAMQIDTPTLTQCQDATINYSGGQGSYALYIVPSEDPCADSVVDIPQQSGTHYNWKVTLPAGGQVELLVEDAAGEEAWSGLITVQNSSDSSCVDPKAVQALNAAKAAPVNASATTSLLSKVPTTPSTTIALPSVSAGYASGLAKTVTPVDPSGAANAAGGGANVTPSKSGAIPHAALPAGSLLAITALFLTVVHL